MADANERGGEKNISIGYHAIEFLLWGQDYTDVNTNVGEGGERPATDFDATVNTTATRRGLATITTIEGGLRTSHSTAS